MSSTGFVTDLNRRYFAGALSPEVVATIADLPVDRDDARRFVERVCMFMQAGGYPAEDVSPMQADMLAHLVARLLPGRWEGRVPPITVAGRHRLIDLLVARRYPQAGRLIDIACGFPPLTTLDSATALPDWDIVGVDRSLPAFLVEDGLGNYCVYDESGRALYFQPLLPTPDAWNALLADWEGSRLRLETLLATLRSGGAVPPGASLTVEPARTFATERLHFVRGDLAAFDGPAADVVRCFNMLLYFDDAFRQQALTHAARLLREGGMFVCGTDWTDTIECRYSTYVQRGGRLEPDEFAMSLDNLTALGVVPWYTLHDDAELLAATRVARTLRADGHFIEHLRRTADTWRAEADLGTRDARGYVGPIVSGLSPLELWTRAVALSHRLDETFGAEAAAVLTRAGWKARVNEVGHLAASLT